MYYALIIFTFQFINFKFQTEISKLHRLYYDAFIFQEKSVLE